MQKSGLKITISVVHVFDRGMEVGYVAFTTYSGSEVHPPTNRVFRISRRTKSRRKAMNPQTASALLKNLARKEARRHGISHVINLD